MTNNITKLKISQRDIREGVNVGGCPFHHVSSVVWWWNAGHFHTEEEALGAFKLAHQQYLDGMGKSLKHWMGFADDADLTAWMSNSSSLPKRRKNPIYECSRCDEIEKAHVR